MFCVLLPAQDTVRVLFNPRDSVCVCDSDGWFFSSSKPVYPFAVHYFKGKVLNALCVLFCLTDQNNGRSHSLPDFRVPIHTHSLEAAFVVCC